MSTDHIEQSIALMGRVEGQELLPHALRLLSEGEPVALERLAAAAGWSVEDVEAALSARTSAERDGQGRLVGFALPLPPTSHRFTLDGARAVYVVRERHADVPHLPRMRCARRVDLPADRPGDPHRAHARRRRPRRPARGDHDRGAALRPARGRALGDLQPRALLQLDRGHRGVGRRTPRRPHLPVEEAFRLDRDVIKRLGWDARQRQAT